MRLPIKMFLLKIRIINQLKKTLIFKKEWHPGIKKYRIYAKDWAGRYYVYDLSWNLIDWEHKYQYLGEGKWKIHKKFQNFTVG